MKNLIIKLIALVSLFGSLAIGMPSAMAQESDANILNIINPTVSNGIQIGDVLNRTIVIEVNTPYQISKTALPMKGEVRNGIELADITVTSSEKAKKNIVSIALRYQVFISAAKPVVMQLPKEEFTLIGGDKALSIKVPAWNFWFSPLVAQGITNAKENLQPQYKPTLINISADHARFWVSLVLFITGLLGLVYVNADKRWLPFMNGAFAQAHRSLKKLPGNQTSEKKALAHMHHAFNNLHGENLFANDIEQFLAAHPKFSILKTDITTFFAQSNASLFGNKHKESEQFMSGLIALSKRLRDCERGV